MEIDKKIILKLIQTLEELKKSIQGQNLNVSDETQEVKEDVSKFELDKERFLNLLTKVEDDVLSQQLQA